MATMSPNMKVCNILVSTRLGCSLDLWKVYKCNCNVQYRPQKFNGLVMRLRKPKATCLVFANGSVVCLGTKCVQAAKRALHKLVENVERAGYDVKLCKMKIGNRVFTGKLRETFDFAELTKKRNVVYEPELFPGLTFKTDRGVVVAHHTGRIIITGCKTVQDCDYTLQRFLGMFGETL